MGGDISLESHLGKGSVFSFDFYVGRVEQLGAGSQLAAWQCDEDKTAVVPVDLSEQKILIVEDNLVNQEVARAMLNKLGATTQIAENGEEALQRLRENSGEFSLILMDCQLPVLDGYATSMAIRSGKAGDENRMIPIIALTANAFPKDRDRCLNAGMNDYMSKPIALAALKKVVFKWIDVKNRQVSAS